ncbi:MAG: Preprotein translocase subunit SecD [Candidatus Woesebacteria bacterium GW2011_GWA1_37_8]|uniref:Protein translocase subunit SecD n=2 Tax=Candidatus Woeseibacteriota TaxID=1752722 RepID=A0A0G0LH70_9BACT|nr:MAG: Preprotein translocase subunit SecD [Microgenomates group bacterium GW2011_GWC1_37_12b]KKQ45960.1 MAG: Preprotein translocase subunit SecD [Candidatus Woesebacteria bacterium GW2011_GWA1_37_8]KKQ87270.1 MAG: Preprotein translocase subunit SecD [Candidatus Woesebacteria bacterium GW2011_GWB1_38_8b]
MRRSILLIITIFAISLYISLPKELPINFSAFGKSFNWKFTRADINLVGGKFNIKKNFDLKLGLDLAGGSHLVFDADLSKVEKDNVKNALESLKEVMERRVNLFGVSEPNVYNSSFEGKQRIVVELPGIMNTKEAIGIIGQTAKLEFAEVGPDEKTGLIPTDLTGADLKSAKVVYDQNNGKPAVSIEFTQEGAEKFGKITEANVGKALPILLDGMPVSAPVVQEKILGGSAQITGNFTSDEAKNLAIQLNAGALPIPVSLVEERTVGATLGANSIQKSIKAGVVGVVMVLIFMILLYGKMGLIADIALLVFAVTTLALYKLIPVVLTLPGIAGFLLSVGMAVDSNILIFERFKEERKQRNLVNALEVSFGRAWDSIRDANIATLVTAFILANPMDFSFLHTSGPVRGFAITLTLGVLVSLFTGLFVSRNLLRTMLIQKTK